MSQARCNYHHGDLRNALIVAAAELIERDGTLDFSMAEAAASAGVSAAAPYRHFADKEELLRAVRELAILGWPPPPTRRLNTLPARSTVFWLWATSTRGEQQLLALMWRTAVIWRNDEKVSEEHGGFMCC